MHTVQVGMSVSFHVELSLHKHRYFIDVHKYPYTLYTGIFTHGCIPGHIHTPHLLSSGCDVNVAKLIYGHLLQWPSFDTLGRRWTSLYLNRMNTPNCVYIFTNTHSFCSTTQPLEAWTPCKHISYVLKALSQATGSTRQRRWYLSYAETLFFSYIFMYSFMYFAHFFCLAICRDFTTTSSWWERANFLHSKSNVLELM